MAYPQLADISHYQPINIDWSAYAKWSKQWDGVARVIMRASVGTGQKDDHFETYWKGATTAGVGQIGVYHYAYPQLNSPEAEADWFTSVVGSRLRAHDFVMLDYEENVSNATPDWAYRFCTRAKQHFNRVVTIYASKGFVAGHLNDSRLAAFPYVMAYWDFDPSTKPACPSPWKSYVIRQYTDRKTDIPGLGGARCDCNVFLGPLGGTTMGVPNGWKDDGVTLTAPNGVPVVRGFREWVLSHPWDRIDFPLAAERICKSVEPGNSSIGGGTRQDFRMTSLGWTPSRGVYKIYVGQDILALEKTVDDQAAALQQATADKDAALAQVQQLTNDNAALQKQIDDLKVQLAQAGQEPPEDKAIADLARQLVAWIKKQLVTA